MRNHGLQKPYNSMQMSTWIMFPFLLGHFILFISLVFPSVISAMATLIFFFSAFSTFYNGALCCKTDSMDDKLYRHLHPGISEDTIKKISFCGCAPFHIPHPLEDKKKREKKRPQKKRPRKNQPSPPQPAEQYHQQQASSELESNNNNNDATTNADNNRTGSGANNLPRRRIFLTSPRDIMARSRRNKALASDGVFFNQSMSDTVATIESGETSANKSFMSNGGSSLLSFTRMTRQQKQFESNFQPDGSTGNNNNTISENTIPEEIKEDEEVEEEEEEKEEVTKYCWVCTTQVHVHSMHCKFCDKCVSKFDHHCMWLNTCIGERNYDYFYKTVISTFFFVLIHTMCIIIFIVGYAAGGKEGVIYKNSYDWFGLHKPASLLIFNIMVLLITLATLGLVGQLLMFHISLRKQKLTTYEFIVKSNTQKRELASMESEIKSRRIMALGRANREGKKWDQLMLLCGKYNICESMDPIRLTILKEQEERAQLEADAANKAELASSDENEDLNKTNNDTNGSASARYPSIQEQDEDIETNVRSNATATAHQQHPEHQYESTTNTATDEQIKSYSYGSSNDVNTNGAVNFNDNPTTSSKVSLSTTASSNAEVKSQMPSTSLSGLAAFRLKNPTPAGSVSDSTASRQQRSSSSKNKVNINSDRKNGDTEHRIESRQQQSRSEKIAMSSNKDKTEKRVSSHRNQQQQREEFEVPDQFDESKLLSTSAAANRRSGFPSHIEFDDSDDIDASSIGGSLISKLTDVRSVAPSLPPHKEENDL